MTSVSFTSLHDFWRHGPLGKDYSDQRLKASGLIFTNLVINLLSLALPILLLQIYDRIIPHKSYGTLAMLVAGVSVALLMEGVLRYCTGYITGWAGASFEHTASRRALKQMSAADIQLLEMEGTATYLQRLAAIMKLRECYSGRVLMTVIDLPFSLLYMVIIAYLGGWIVCAPLLVAALFVLTSLRFSKRMRINITRHSHADENKYNFIIDVLDGIHTVKSLGMEAQMMRRFEGFQAEATQSAHQVGLLSSYAVIANDVFSNAAMAVTVVCGSLLVMKGTLSVGGLAACTLLVGRMMQPLQRALDSWSRFQDFLVARKHSQEILHLPSRSLAQEVLPEPKGALVLNGVSFIYAVAGAKSVFEYVDLEVKPGEAVAITGAKGSGKSTLLQMMMGTYAPVQGSLRIDGFDPAMQDSERLRPFISYLPQKSVLFRGTVMENLTGFREDPDAMDKCRQACAELGIDDILNSLPQGYSTYLGDGASDPIAPGVKQRLALARALAQESRIILFDEADRALDRAGYRYVLESLWRRQNNCTLIIASEDEALHEMCSRIYRLTHDGLVMVPKRR